jgi:hypothetical protein
MQHRSSLLFNCSHGVQCASMALTSYLTRNMVLLCAELEAKGQVKQIRSHGFKKH